MKSENRENDQRGFHAILLPTPSGRIGRNRKFLKASPKKNVRFHLNRGKLAAKLSHMRREFIQMAGSNGTC